MQSGAPRRAGNFQPFDLDSSFFYYFHLSKPRDGLYPVADGASKIKNYSMKEIILILCCITGTVVAFGQALPKERIELYSGLTTQLDSIYNEDQKYRQMLGDIEAKHGLESKEMKDLWKTIGKKDSINLIRVRNILDKYGWLGSEVVGDQGNATLFLVIQHSDQKTQEDYLPMMRDAVKNGNC